SSLLIPFSVAARRCHPERARGTRATRRIWLCDAKDLVARDAKICLTRVPDRPQKLPVPRRRNTLARPVGAGLVAPRGDPCVAPLAAMPVLPLGVRPEAHGVVGIEARLPA